MPLISLRNIRAARHRIVAECTFVPVMARTASGRRHGAPAWGAVAQGAPRSSMLSALGKSALLRAFRKRDLVHCGVTLQVPLQKDENICNDLQFGLHDIDGINLGSREFR